MAGRFLVEQHKNLIQVWAPFLVNKKWHVSVFIAAFRPILLSNYLSNGAPPSFKLSFLKSKKRWILSPKSTFFLKNSKICYGGLTRQ